MSDELNQEIPSAGKKPKQTRRKNEDRRIRYSIENGTGRLKEVGTFPESSIGSPIERRIPIYAREMHFPFGDYLAEIRNSKGHYESTVKFTLADDSPEIETARQTIEVEPEADEPDFGFQSGDDLELRFFLIQQENERLKADLARQQSTAQSSQNEYIRMFELLLARDEAARAREDAAFNRALKLSQAMQQPQPQQNPAQMMMEMLQSTIQIQRGVKQLGEEIAPAEKAAGGNTIDSITNLIDSVSKNGAKLAPLLLGGLTPKATAQPTRTTQTRPEPQQSTNGNGAGSLTELFAKASAGKTNGNGDKSND